MEYDDNMCEPCFWQEEKRKAIAHINWDFTPVCEWHIDNDWNKPVPVPEK